MSELLRRLHYLLHRRRLDAELANDMEFHREMAARDGRRLGNTLRLREEAREAWGWMWIDRLAQDLRYAARLLRRSPGFTMAAVLTLAIGIGANVAAFGFFDLIVLRPLPVREPETLLRFTRHSPEAYASTLPYPAVAFYREHSRSLSAVLALDSGKLAMEGDQNRLDAHFVSANFFQELGAAPRLGRLLDPARDEPANAEPVVVLGHGFWQRRFGADPLVIGKTIRLNGKPAAVIGVASSDFSGLSLDEPDLWAPLTRQPYFVSGSHLLTDWSNDGSGVRMWGRLQPGQTSQAAEEELRALAAALRRQHPNVTWKDESLPSQPGGYATGSMTGTRRGTGPAPASELYPVAALIGTLVLLILAVSCSNLGSLLLARGVAREREIMVRVAVGAGRTRLIRQLFTESLLLALLGSLAGLALGYVVLRNMLALTGAPPWLDATPNGRVILFAIGVGFLAAILFGLMPAWQVARQRHRATLMRQILVGAQIAASCVLLIVAGLLVRALDHALSTHPGFEYQQVISIDPGLATHGYSPAQARTYLDTLQSRLRELPGIASVCLTSTPPLGNRMMVSRIEIDGRTISVHINRVTPPFFETMKIPLLRGRSLQPGDARSIIVSEPFARFHWPAENPLGKQFSTGVDAAGAPVNHTVVGVSGRERLVALKDPEAVEMYQLAQPADLASLVVLAKTSGPPEDVAAAVTRIARSGDPTIFPEVQLLKNSFRRKLRDAEGSALVVGLFGLISHLLACLGIVGVVAFAVSQRTKEIGIRMALGATPAHVLSVVLRHFSRPVVVGLALGVGGAAALSQLLRRELYGISHLDPVSYLAAVAAFAVTVAVAALLPARRALRVDPVNALRNE